MSNSFLRGREGSSDDVYNGLNRGHCYCSYHFYRWLLLEQIFFIHNLKVSKMVQKLQNMKIYYHEGNISRPFSFYLKNWNCNVK